MLLRMFDREFPVLLAMALIGFAATPADKGYIPGAPLSVQRMRNLSPSSQYDTPPKFLRGNAPYTRVSPLTERERGPSSVVILFTIGTDGRTRDLRVIGQAGPPCAQLAINAVKQWQFEPARKRGKPVAVIIRVPFLLYPQHL
jgi:TonB family protein